MASWKIGQKLVCLKKGQWREDWTDGRIRYCNGPKYMEVVTYNGIGTYGDALILEYPEVNNRGEPIGFCEKYFRPLTGESAKSELISSFKEVTETSDCPIPQTETA